MNMQQIMKQAQAMQKKMEQMQEEMANKQFEGSSGAGAVKITLNGKFNIESLIIDPELFKENDHELISDLVIAAFNEAKTKMDSESKNGMSNMLGGMPMPPGFKMPF